MFERRFSPSPAWSHPSLLTLQWLTASMSGMARQDLTQFFISCLLLIPCTGLKGSQCQKKVTQSRSGGASCPPVNWALFFHKMLNTPRTRKKVTYKVFKLFAGDAGSCFPSKVGAKFLTLGKTQNTFVESVEVFEIGAPGGVKGNMKQKYLAICHYVHHVPSYSTHIHVYI